MLGRINKPNTPPPKFVTPTSNGINDGKDTIPTIYGIPNGGMTYIVNITDDFDTPDCYGEVIALLSNATELDEIRFNICSSGGYLSSLNMLLGFKEMCNARQVHILFSEASSAATAFFLSPADQYIVGDRASFMLHEVQFGSGGTSSNVRKHTEHVFKENERFVRDTYQYFLDDSEISDVLRGIEIYLDAESIRDRLTKRQEILEQQHKESVQQTIEDETSLEVFTDDELTEELKLIQAEVKKRKKVNSK